MRTLQERVQELLNSYPLSRDAIAAAVGEANVWDTTELQREFEVEAFLAPFAMVRRRSTGKLGTVLFQHHPRLYFAFVEEAPTSVEEICTEIESQRCTIQTLDEKVVRPALDWPEEWNFGSD